MRVFGNKLRGISFVLILLIFATACQEQQQKERKKLPPEANAIKEKALAYFNKEGKQYHREIVPMLLFLERKFDVRFPDLKAQVKSSVDDPGFYPHMKLLMNAENMSSEEIGSLIDQSKGYNKLMAEIFCIRKREDPQILERLRPFLKMKRKYKLTHSVLMLKWLQEAGIAERDVKFHLRELKEPMQQLINFGKEATDLNIEARVFANYVAYDFDKGDEKFLEKVKAAQQEDGGWKWNGPNDQKPSHDHPTTLALWYLLQLEGNGDESVTWIP